MARKRKVTTEVIESMRMLHDQGVKVAMIADVLSFSKWTVYQAKNADWNLDKYVAKRNAYFEAQKKDVRDTSILNGESSVIPPDNTAYFSNLTENGFTDTVNKLTSIAGGIVEINRTLAQLVSIFQHIDDELTGETTTTEETTTV
tara:strand:+ start:1329 stop:1763 length:435 start_codon:yes stop_codon:yes gene_type:complete